MFVRSAFSDIFLADMLPNLRFLIENQFREKRDRIPDVFKVVRMGDGEGGAFQTSQIAGVGPLVETSEGGSLNYGDLVQEYDKNHEPLKYALGFKISDEAIDDGRYREIDMGLRSLSRSAHNVKQTNAFNVLNRAFNSSYTGPDSKELCATDHPSQSGNQRNELSTAADLDFTSLSLAVRDMMDHTDSKGILLDIIPDRLIIPNELVHDARELLNSMDRPDTADRSVNALRDDNLKLIQCPYLSDADAWFLSISPSSDDFNVYFIERKPFRTEQVEDFDNGAVKIRAEMRFVTGWGDWRGIFGTPGAA